MEMISINGDSDSREEGEIIDDDDDDLEDISDNSLTIPSRAGKFFPRRDHLRALSLSSVSEEDLSGLEESEVQLKETKPPRTRRLSKKRRSSNHRISISSDTSDCEDEVITINKRLLKEAIRLDNSGELHRNSLRTRLKGMVDDNLVASIPNNAADAADIKNEEGEVKNEGEKAQTTEDDELDSELIQLRLEALKTAVMNKFKHRKKRKAPEIVKTELFNPSIKIESEFNKENSPTHNISLEGHELPPKKPCLESKEEEAETKKEIEQNASDEDEDVLRALLLASISKKITKSETKKIQTNVPSTGAVKKDMPQNIAINKPKSTKYSKSLQTNNGKKTTQKAKMPTFKIKPLIINFNSDSSDSDAENPKTKAKENAKQPLDHIQLTVDKFLKEQRAQVEAKLASIPSTNVATPKNKNSLIAPKSAVKLLPKSKQIEYQQLLQKIRSAERKPRVRRSSFKSEGKPLLRPKKLVKNKSVLKVSQNKLEKSQEKNDLEILQESLTKQEDKSGRYSSFKNCMHNNHAVALLRAVFKFAAKRLQIQGKYNDLVPIMRKINAVSTERKQHEVRIKRLLKELNEARNQLCKSQEQFSAYVTELYAKKEAIDKRQVYHNESNIKKGANHVKAPPRMPFTSTPIRKQELVVSLEESAIEAGKVEVKHTKVNVQDNVKKTKDIAAAVPEYISPLGPADRQGKEIDPLGIMCPYEINGVCRDKDCSFKHYQ